MEAGAAAAGGLRRIREAEPASHQRGGEQGRLDESLSAKGAHECHEMISIVSRRQGAGSEGESAGDLNGP